MSANGFASYVNVFAAVRGGALVSCGAPGVDRAAPREFIFVSGTSFSSSNGGRRRRPPPRRGAVGHRHRDAQRARPRRESGDCQRRIGTHRPGCRLPRRVRLARSPRCGTGRATSFRTATDRATTRTTTTDEVAGGGQSVAGNLRLASAFETVQFSLRSVHHAGELGSSPGQVAQFYVPSDIFSEPARRQDH